MHYDAYMNTKLKRILQDVLCTLNKMHALLDGIYNASVYTMLYTGKYRYLYTN